jgi:apolipoprotein N-acyltransferase
VPSPDGKDRGVIFRSMKPKEICLSLLSGVTLILAFPNFNLEILAWVGFVPLFWVIRKKSPSQAAFLGWLAGFAFFTGLLPWIYYVLSNYGHLPGPVSVFFLVLLTAYLALFFSAFAFLLRWVQTKTDLPEILLAPPLWVSLEYLRGVLFSGFPWALMGYSQFLTLPMVQIADITGVYGVSFLIMLMNVAFFRVLEVSVDRSLRPALKEILAAGLLLFLSGAYGYWRLSEMPPQDKQGTPLRIALAQGNIPQDIKWEPKFQGETVETYIDLTRRAASAGPLDMIIWPETATPFFFQDSTSFRSRILDLAREVGAPLLFGSPGFDRQGREIYYYNSAFLISARGKIEGRYDKIHLVPFGEYAPLSGVLGFTRDIIGAMGDFHSGGEVKNLTIPHGKFGVLICYEAIFPGLTRRFARKGAQFLVNITNDAWFGRTAAPFQHISMARLRAIENRVPVARAANTGISGFIDPAGRLIQSSELFTKTTLSGTIYLKKRWSFYNQFGDVFVYLCIGYAFLFLIFVGYRGEKGVERNTG